ncbi:MAG: hypothetical protein D6725_07025 [Planctomycetota bacterium]|nr:MAG: hypothetical protein D6725_07025 [Planctomycetota bacterium]
MRQALFDRKQSGDTMFSECEIGATGPQAVARVAACALCSLFASGRATAGHAERCCTAIVHRSAPQRATCCGNHDSR